MNPDDVLNNISYIRVYNTEHQLHAVSDMASQQDLGRIALIIVDSSIAHYRAEYQGRGELAERQAPKSVLASAAASGQHLQMCRSYYKPGRNAVY